MINETDSIKDQVRIFKDLKYKVFLFVHLFDINLQSIYDWDVFFHFKENIAGRRLAVTQL